MRVTIISFLAFFILSIISCIHDPISPIEQNPEEINLQWNASYASEKKEDALTGLFWCLSHLGAQNTNTTSSRIEVAGTIIHLHIGYLGFSHQAKASLTQLHRSILQSPEYIQNNTVDIGRYITLLIGASAHYYHITGIPENLTQQLAPYSFAPETGLVNNSSISDNHRTIQFSTQHGLKQLFLSTEIDSITGDTLEFETMELMGNGQYKYAIFDANRQRIPSADKGGVNAGKPAKCMWCHESNINPLFQIQNDYTGYLTFQQLQDTLVHFRNELGHTQSFLQNGVDFSKNQQHTQMELQYLMFKQPSSVRLANEWNINVNEVEQLLANQATFTNPEFAFLPAGYIRNNIEMYAPFQGLITSDNVREHSITEVNYID
ncbi:MAG: hypothetical protein ACI85Q_000346 [Salibacteraceae bacterium]|jgi:hypothetical protein